MSACDELRLELGAYVLGGLSEAEHRRVRQHLERCLACRREHEELAGLPALLGLAGSPSPASPPAGLRERVLSAAARRRSRNRWLLAVAAAALLGLLIGASTVLWLDRSPGQPVVVELASEASWDAAGRAAFSWSEGELTVRLMLRDVAQLEEQQVYEAWLAPVSGGPPVSIGTFDPDRSGQVDVRLRARGPLMRWRSFWVTAEPDASDPSHDGPTVVAAPIPPLPGK